MSKKRLVFALAAGLAILAAAPQVVYDAPGVTVDLGSAGVMHRTGVGYPSEALNRGVQGTVVVEVKLDSNGNVADARVVSGPDELRKSALQSVLQWHLMKSLAGSSRQVSIAFRLPEAAPGEAPATAAAAPTESSAIAAGRQVASQLPWVGRKVKAINVVGLSDELRADLLSQLPVHEGDTLSFDSFIDVVKAARAFDEHLGISAPSAGGNEVTLQISAPGAVTTSAGTMPVAFSRRATATADAEAPPPARIRVGGGVQQTKLITQPRPVYPAEAKLAHVTGAVSLSAIIGKDGAIQHLEVISGHPLLIPSALEAVRQWVYQPTLLNGEPVEVVTQIDVNYTLSQ
jgi:TonB family protein